MSENNLNIFIEKTEHAFTGNELVKLILSKKRRKDTDLKKLTIKQIIIKENQKFTFNYNYKTKDITKNYDLEQGIRLISELLNTEFYSADLFTTRETVQYLTNKKNNSKILTSEPTFTNIPKFRHDRIKKKRISVENNIYLHELGITTSDFKIKKDMHDKYRQINKYLEIIENLMAAFKNKKEIKIVDMGSGKGYLTFALFDFLKNSLNLSPYITGIEYREDLVLKSNSLAEKVNFKELKFIQGSIEQSDIGQIDMLIALHACDTATDDAIYKGIKTNAKLIIAAPCCHKQIRKQFNVKNEMASVVKHGILKERQAELITDGIRALILELYGYKTKVFEFIATEHTPKNLMIVASKQKGKIIKDDIINKINAIKEMFGVNYHYLEKLLNLNIN